MFLEQQTGLLASPTALEEYFLLYHKVENAERLKTFVNANDDQTQTLVGEKDLLRMAHNKTKELEKNKARLQQLKNKLMCQDNLTEQQILSQGKDQLARMTLMKLQKQLEMLYFSVAKRTKEISSLAGRAFSSTYYSGHQVACVFIDYLLLIYSENVYGLEVNSRNVTLYIWYTCPKCLCLQILVKDDPPCEQNVRKRKLKSFLL